MALDPNIALGFAPTQLGLDVGQSALIGADYQNKMAQIPVAQAQAQLTQAQVPLAQADTAMVNANIPGAIADAATKSRTLSAQQWYGRNANTWTETDPTTGKPVIDPVTNLPKVDYSKLMAAANTAGFSDLAPEIAQNYLGTQAKILSNATSSTDLNIKKTDAGNGYIALAVQEAKNLSPAAQKPFMVNAISHAVSLFGSTNNTDTLTAAVNNPDPTALPSTIDAMYKGEIPAEQQTKLNQNQEGITMAKNEQFATSTEAYNASITEGSNANQLGKVNDALANLKGPPIAANSTDLGKRLGLGSNVIDATTAIIKQEIPGSNPSLADLAGYKQLAAQALAIARSRQGIYKSKGDILSNGSSIKPQTQYTPPPTPTPAGNGLEEGSTSTYKGAPIIFHNGKWQYK